MYKIIGANLQEYGPVPADVIRQWIAEGRADANTRAQAEGSTEWKPLREFPEFTAQFPPASAIPATPVPPVAPSAPPLYAPAMPGQPYLQTTPHVPSYLWQAIVLTVCCCPPTGIVAIVYAAQVNSKLMQGNFAGAEAASRNARIWCWVSLGLGVLANFATLIGMSMLNLTSGFNLPTQ